MWEPTFVWHQDNGIWFCHVGLYAGQVEEVDDFNETRYAVRILWSGERNVIVDSYEYADTPELGQEWVEERIRQLHQPNEIYLALAILTRLVSEMWAMQPDDNGIKIYYRSIPLLGDIWVRESGDGWVYHGTGFAKTMLSGRHKTLTEAKNHGISALIAMYFAQTIKVDGNTVLNFFIEQVNRQNQLMNE